MSFLIILSDPLNIRYTTGLKMTNSYVVLSDKLKIKKIFTHMLFLGEAPLSQKKYMFCTPEQMRGCLTDYMAEHGAETIYCDRPKKLRGLFAKGVMHKYSSADANRRIKTDIEKSSIKQAVKISEDAFLKALENVKEGITELELKAEIDYFMYQYGAENLAFPTITAFSENASMPHHSPAYRKLKRGDYVLIDWGAMYKGYCADITRMVTFGKYSAQMTAHLHNLRETQQEIIDLISAGEKKVSIFNKIYVDKIGKNHIFHSLGHGFGLEVHEPPFLRENTILKPGNMITIEPGLYEAGKFGARIEDDIFITEHGGEVLTSLEKIIKL